MTVRMLDVALLVAAVPAALASVYLLLLTIAAFGRFPDRRSAPRLRIDVVVPAHDEEAGIAATVASLRAVDYPASLFRIVVVADNCTDGTAGEARAAGATVLTRSDPSQRGKGHALAFAFGRLLSEGWSDAVAVVDADCLVTPNLLRAFAARIEEGAGAVQAGYGVANPAASWQAALMAVAFTCVNGIRSRGRERLGLSAGLHGTGMCFAAPILRAVPHPSDSIVEDLEYGLRLGAAGHRVHFAGEAAVRADAPEAGSASQRRRWEAGRRAAARSHAAPLLRRALAARDPVLLDLGLDLLVPPLARLGAVTAAGALVTAVGSLSAGRLLVAAWPWWLTLAGLVVHVAAGWRLSGTGLAGLSALLHAPAYLAWKVGLALGARRDPAGTWVRTERRGSP